MNTSWAFHDCDEQTKAEAERYWEQKQPRIERLLRNYPDDLCILRLNLYETKRHTFELRAVLQLPTGTLIAEEDAPTFHAAIDIVVDTLLREIKKHKEKVRKDYVFRRKNRRRENLSAAGSYLENDVRQRRKEAFFELLKAITPGIAKHAREQLRQLRARGVPNLEGVTAQDLVDDVVLRAWEQFDDRPQHLELELWLQQLLQQRIAELVGEPGKLPLTVSFTVDDSEEHLTPDEDLLEPEFWLERVVERPPEIMLQELLPDEHLANALEEKEMQEMLQVVERTMLELPETPRNFLLLHIEGGYDVDEIAAITNHDPKIVQEAIDTAIEKIRRNLRELIAS